MILYADAQVKLVDGFSNMLLNMGLPGFVITILLFALWQVAKKYVEVQEKRVAETQTNATALTSTAAALNRLSDILAQRGKNS